MGAFLNKKLGKVLLAVLVAAVPFSVDAASIVRAPNNLGLVGYWSFDEGVGTRVSDLSGNGYEGTLAGPAWTAGKLKGALSFVGESGTSGEGQYITFGNLQNTLASWTYTAWVKTSTGGRMIGSIGVPPVSSNGQLQPYILGGGHVGVAFGGNTFYPSTGVNVVDGEWHHVAITYGGSLVSIYIDGELDNSTTKSWAPITGEMRMGHGYWSGAYRYSWNGLIDEVRLYSRALAPSEIQTLYNNTKGVIVGTTNNTYTDGLVAHYTFDGGTISGTTVQDVVGENDGVINNATPTIGRIGQGMQFAGTSSFIGVDIAQTFPGITVAFWANPDSAQTNDYPRLLAVEIGGTHADHELSVADANAYRFRFGIGEAVNSDPNFFIPGELHHYAAAYDLSSIRFYRDGVLHSTQTMTRSPTAFAIKRIADNVSSTRSYKGLLDDFRVYDRSLSPEEIRGLAGSSIATLHSSSDNLVTGGLVGHWTFDSGTLGGGTAQDVSGGGHHLTTHGSSSASGVLNQAASFNGSSNYTQVSYAPELNPSSFSVSLWARVDGGAGGYRSAITSRDSSPQSGYIIYAGNNNKWQFWIGDGSNWQTMSGGDVEIGEWVHIVATYGSGAMSLYENGILVATANRPFLQNTDEPLRIGAGSNGLPPQYYFNGLIDDVRVYNRVIAPHEIQTLYSMGQ